MEAHEYDDPACYEFLRLIDTERVSLIGDNGFTCMIAILANVLEVALYMDPKNRWYVRTLDFIDCGSGTDEERETRWKKYYALQNNFVGMWEAGDGRNSSIGQRLLTSYRASVQDPEAPMCQLNNRRGHGNPRTSTWFLPIEILPYILTRFEFYANPSRPEYEPVWDVIRRLQPLAGCPLDMIKPTNSATVRRRRILSVHPTSREGVPEPAPGERTVEEELAEDDERLGNRDKRALVSRIRYLGKALMVRDQKFKRDNEDLLRKNKALADQVHRLKHNEQRQIDFQEAYVELKGRFDAAELRWNLMISEEPGAGEARSAPSEERAFFAMSQKRQWHQVNRAFKLSQQASAKLQQTGAELDRMRAERDSVRHKYDELAGGATKEVHEAVVVELEASKARVQELTEQLAQATIPLLAEVQRRAEGVPAVRGRICENEIHNLLRENVGEGCSVLLTRGKTRHADFMLLYRKSSRIIGYALIDAKHYEDNVGSNQIVKLQRDIDNCTSIYGVPPIWASIISLTTSISHVGVSQAPDFLYGNVRVHLVHKLRETDDGTLGILSLLETGALDVEAAYCPSLHRTLSDELVAKRDRELNKLEASCSESNPSSRPGRSASASSRSRSRSHSTRSRQRRMTSISESGPSVRFQDTEDPDLTLDPIQDIISSESSVRQVAPGPRKATHINHVVNHGPLTQAQIEARTHILESYEFDPSASVTKSELKEFLAETMDIQTKNAEKLLRAVILKDSCSVRHVLGLRLKQ